MDRVGLAGLMKMELRDGRTIRLCDGGFLVVGSETYRSSDDEFGTIGSMDPFREGVGDEVPAFKMTFLPVSGTAAARLSNPGMQGSRTRFYIAEYDLDTHVVISLDQMGDFQIDRPILRVGRGKRELDIEFVSTAERLFTVNDGNSLNPTFHKRVHPGEKGEDNATGIGIGVAWGTEAQVTGGTTVGSVIDGIFGG